VPLSGLANSSTAKFTKHQKCDVLITELQHFSLVVCYCLTEMFTNYASANNFASSGNHRGWVEPDDKPNEHGGVLHHGIAAFLA